MDTQLVVEQGFPSFTDQHSLRSFAKNVAHLCLTPGHPNSVVVESLEDLTAYKMAKINLMSNPEPLISRQRSRMAKGQRVLVTG